MCSMRLAFSSDGPSPLTSLLEGEDGIVVDVRADRGGRSDRLLALGVTPGAKVTMLQRFPGIVFLCDQTELAVERGVADGILIKRHEQISVGSQQVKTAATDWTAD